MKKWAIRIIGIIVILAIIGFIFRDKIGFKVLSMALAPAEAFETYTPPTAPDYALRENWAAYPGMESGASQVHPGIGGDIYQTGAHVFYVHPTTFINKSAWNAPLEDEEANGYVDEFVMTDQASAFAGCCEVHAPRYRQATMWSYWDETGSGIKAREFAYADVERAFDSFIANKHPQAAFIIAGHSQGAEHVVSLLENRITGTRLLDQMIAAYPVGIGVDPEKLAKSAPDIPACQSATQTHCYVSWNSLGAKASVWPDLPGSTCVNPLSWEANDKPVPAEKNPGSIAFSAQSDRFETGLTGAQCLHDRLLVGPINSDIYDDNPVNFGKDNFHIMDFNLFYASVHQNAIDRATTYNENE